jgi:hypothetical protein
MSVIDFLERKDNRSVAQYLSDDPKNPIDWTTLAANPPQSLLDIIMSACGMLESAVLRSKIYQVSDLQILNGASSAYVKDILSSITMYMIMSRRTGPAPSEVVINNYETAIKALEDLSNGVRIFSFSETARAGLPVNYQMQYWDRWTDNYVTQRYNRVFGTRQADRRLC